TLHKRPFAIAHRGDRMSDGQVRPKRRNEMLSLLRERPLVLVGWVFALALGLQYIGIDLLRSLASPNWQIGAGTMLGRDFANVYTAGHLVAGGPLPAIYDIPAYRAYQQTLFDGAVLGHNYSYTPVSFF